MKPSDSSIFEIAREIWADSLNISVSEVIVTDNYLSSGGGSMSIIKMLVKVNRKFSVEIDYERFFELPTFDNLLACLAEVLSEKEASYTSEYE